MPKSGHFAKLTPFPFFPQLLTPRNQTNKLCSPPNQTPSPLLMALPSTTPVPPTLCTDPCSCFRCHLHTGQNKSSNKHLLSWLFLTRGQRQTGFPSLLEHRELLCSPAAGRSSPPLQGSGSGWRRFPSPDVWVQLSGCLSARSGAGQRRPEEPWCCISRWCSPLQLNPSLAFFHRDFLQ